MALKADKLIMQENFEGQLVAKDVYWKIQKITGNKNELQINVFGYLNESMVGQIASAFKPDLEGKNFIAQAYEHLKTLPEFNNSVNC